MPNILMKCGCVALAHDSEQRPVCPVHIGITLTATQVEDNPPDLTGRWAKCSSCNNERPSSYSLPFFTLGRYEPTLFNAAVDSYYCGCRGWD